MADVVVAGGGPVGLAAAIGAALRGFEVVVLERTRPPIDRACGEGVMPDGVAALEALGVNLRETPSYIFKGIRFIDQDLTAEGRFPSSAGLGVRRTVLHDALVRRAESLDVQLLWGVRVNGVADTGFETDGGVVRGRWLVGADGRASRVRTWAELDGRRVRLRRFGVRRHFEIEPWSDLVEVHWAERCEAYVTPVGERLVGVAMLWSGRPARFDDLLEHFPGLKRRLGESPVVSADRGAGPLLQRCRRVVNDNLALVGDASGYIDAITGEGLALGFRQASALVDAIEAGDLASYVAEHSRIGRDANAMTRLLLVIEKRPWLRRRVMRSLAADPSLMTRFLTLKVGSDGPRMARKGGLIPLVAASLRGGS
jgi:flavin-dependent dehydrogenase